MLRLLRKHSTIIQCYSTLTTNEIHMKIVFHETVTIRKGGESEHVQGTSLLYFARDIVDINRINVQHLKVPVQARSARATVRGGQMVNGRRSSSVYSTYLKMLGVKLFLLTIVTYLSSGSPVTLEEGATIDRENENKSEDTTLRLVTVVMRHGERAPQDTYPNDPYVNNSMEPYGWGQLTNEGRRSQYNQGLYLRERYSDFLGPIYSPDIFYLQCTAVDRTKMSALLEAAALWRPTEQQSFKPDLPWQPVTLFYQPRSEDTLMLIWDMCPRYTKLRHTITSLPEVQKVQQDNVELYRELTTLTGMTISSPEDVNSLYGTLTAEKQMNLTLPEWTEDYYPDKLEPLTLYDFELNGYNDVLKRLKGGPFIKKIVTDMLAKRDETIEPVDRKMFMYVGHDSTVVTLLDVLHVWNNQMPHYNIMTMIELHEDTNGWNVQVFLRNTTDHEPYPLTIPGCTTVCPLDKFIEIVKPMIPDDWKEECKVEGDYTPPPAPLP